MQLFVRCLRLLCSQFDGFAFLLFDAEQFADIILQALLLSNGVAIKLLRSNMSGFLPVDTTLQTVFGHCLGIGILILFQLDARHYIIGT